MYQEKDNLELKRVLTNEVKDEIVAFLNTMDGTIRVGVEDNGEIYEPFLSEDRDIVDTKVGNWLQEAIYPLPGELVRHYFNDQGILVIEVKEGSDKPYYLKGKGPRPEGVYKRVGRSIRKASDDEILRMIMSSRHYVYEEDISDEQDLSFEYLAKEFGKQGMELTDRNMVSLGLVRSDGKYTNLAFMLSDQSDVTVKIAEYDKHYNFRLKKQFTGPLVELFHETKEQADRLNDVSATIDVRTFRRNEIESYPGASLREMILNAFVHADYFIRSNIKVEFFGDRCRITSPGGIFNASMEEIMNGTQTYRNHNLVNVFYKLGLIENFGTGIPRTMEAYDGQERQPVFKATENFFYVTLPNLNWSADDQINDQINDQTNDHINTNMNEVDLKILKEIYDHPGIKVPGIYENLANKGMTVTNDQIRNSIKRKISDCITYEGSRKTGGYYIRDIVEDAKYEDE